MSSVKFLKVVVLVLLGCGCALLAQAQTYTVLYSFAGAPDGVYPEAGVIFDSAGNLYGTTLQGGASNAGTVFKLDSTGHESLLYSFTGGVDGGNPTAGLLLGANGNLYGTAQTGGSAGQGVAFQLALTGTETAIHAFQVHKDGNAPGAALFQDAAGNLYGTTILGGKSNRGTVFQIDPAQNETVLHNFKPKIDGSFSYSPLIQDAAGNLYGTTAGGGATCGTVFKLTLPSTETVLHKFCKGDGRSLRAGLVMDSSGFLYGTTVYGGAHRAGTVFKVNSATGEETILYSFSNGTDGGDPYGGLVRDSRGNLYGTTYYGGAFGFGTIFKLDPAGNETVLHSFAGGSDGLGPMAGLTRDAAGNLYGTTVYGGANGVGVVFKLVP